MFKVELITCLACSLLLPMVAFTSKDVSGLKCADQNVDGYNYTMLQTNEPLLASNLALNYIYATYGTNGTMRLHDLATMLLEIGSRQSKDKSEYDDNLAKLSCNFQNLFHEVDWSQTPVIAPQDLIDMCPSLLQLLSIDTKSQRSPPSPPASDTLGKKSTAEIWGFGLLSVFIISLCSLVGISVLPIMHKPIYDKVLLGLICLAVGTLSGNAVFQLIPEGFEIQDDEKTVYRSAIICVGIYLFYFVNIFLEIVFGVEHTHDLEQVEERSNKSNNIRKEDYMSNCAETGDCSGARMYTLNGFDSPCDSNDYHIVSKDHPSEDNADERNSKLSHSDQSCDDELLTNETSVAVEKSTCFIFKNYKNIKAIAWMITIADAMHNFIDGMAIGASYSVSRMNGISTSVAIFCEEFPHELGDFAILLSAGMSFKQAAFFNFLSACSCFLGLILGITLGHGYSSSGWIFALAGGVFLYIALGGMLPEAKEQTCKKSLRDSPWLCFIIQNIGILTGFLVMFLLTLYTGPTSTMSLV